MSRKVPLKVGITGGIGAGKTIVSKIFSLLNIPVYNADDRAKWLMQHNKGLKKEIIDYFGNESFLPDGVLNRTFLAQKIFGDPSSTGTINELVHPVVRNDFDSWHRKQHSPYVLKEAALLFETGSYKELDKTINVSAPEVLRVKRVMERDPQRNKEQIEQIINRQMPESKKIKLADFIIRNDDAELVIPQVLKIDAALS